MKQKISVELPFKKKKDHPGEILGNLIFSSVLLKTRQFNIV